jgi:hypothetical protein
MLDISGALTGALTLSGVPSVMDVASGAGGCAVAKRRAPIPRPATNATRAITAIEATAHGRVAEMRGSDVGREPTAAPQRWQNFAPADSEERQAVHSAPSNGAPHDEQKRPPVDGALHEGQVAGVVMREK